MRTFFDTNVLVYSCDERDIRKREVANGLIEEAIAAEEFVVSAQVLGEFYVASQRCRLLGPSEALELVRFWSGYDAVANTPELLIRGIGLHQAHSISLWDALVVEAAREAQCAVLLTEDLQHGRRFGELEIVNPFLASAHEPRSRYSVKPRKRAAAQRRSVA